MQADADTVTPQWRRAATRLREEVMGIWARCNGFPGIVSEMELLRTRVIQHLSLQQPREDFFDLATIKRRFASCIAGLRQGLAERKLEDFIHLILFFRLQKRIKSKKKMSVGELMKFILDTERSPVCLCVSFFALFFCSLLSCPILICFFSRLVLHCVFPLATVIHCFFFLLFRHVAMAHDAAASTHVV